MHFKDLPLIRGFFKDAGEGMIGDQTVGQVIEQTKADAITDFGWTDAKLGAVEDILSEVHTAYVRDQIASGETPFVGQRVGAHQIKSYIESDNDFLQSLEEQGLNVDDIAEYNDRMINQYRSQIQPDIPALIRAAQSEEIHTHG